MTLPVGADAPDFSLDGTGGDPGSRRQFSLHEYRGQPVCTVQLTTYTNDITRFADVGAAVLALSPQSVEAHEHFAAQHGGFAFPLLADMDKHVGEAFGTLGPLGFYRRSVFVIDAGGVIRYAHRSTAGLTFRPVDEIIEAVQLAV